MFSQALPERIEPSHRLSGGRVGRQKGYPGDLRYRLGGRQSRSEEDKQQYKRPHRMSHYL
jgi:hypothetical protein